MKEKKKHKKGLNKRWVFGVTGIVGLLLLVVLGSIQEKQTSNINSLDIETDAPAPDFTLQSTRGNISLDDYKGKNVVLYFYEGNG